MMTHHEFNHILNSINTLSPEQMRRLRRELDTKLAASETTPKTILELVDELRGRVPPEEFSKLPTDGASRLDHYIHGDCRIPNPTD